MLVTFFIGAFYLIRGERLKPWGSSHDVPGAPRAQPFGPGCVVHYGDNLAVYCTVIPPTAGDPDAIRRSRAQRECHQCRSSVCDGALRDSQNVLSDAPSYNQPACRVGRSDIGVSPCYIATCAKPNGIERQRNQVRAALRSIAAQDKVLGNPRGIARVRRASLSSDNRANAVGLRVERFAPSGVIYLRPARTSLLLALVRWRAALPARDGDRWRRDER